MQLIGLSGAARSGKDTIGNYIVINYNFLRYAFADPLKKAASEMFGIPLNNFHDDDKKEVVDSFWGFSPRQIAQLLGTECGRKVFRDDIWIKRAEMAWIQHNKSVDKELNKTFGSIPKGANGMIITDIRFENEAQFVKDMGGTVIHVVRPGFEGNVGVSNHASEAGYPDNLKDFIVINDGSLEDLYNKIDNLNIL